MAAQNNVQLTAIKESDNHNKKQVPEEDSDYSQRSQWLRAATLGATDGLVTTASLMIGVGAVQKDINAMILVGFAALFAGACSMAIGEFVSVYSQLDIELAQIKRETKIKGQNHHEQQEEEDKKEGLPNPLLAAVASAVAFSLGGIIPILAAGFISNHKVRMGVVVAAVSLGLFVFGGVGAILGKSPAARSCARVLIGGWMAMAITFGLTKLIGTAGMEM
ncbi:Vacuolar iron transporter -like protein 4 [Capsicum chinense]|nr:Vacuolar iron transporter -like protein 4 [Capsicum chinense]